MNLELTFDDWKKLVGKVVRFKGHLDTDDVSEGLIEQVKETWREGSRINSWGFRGICFYVKIRTRPPLSRIIHNPYMFNVTILSPEEQIIWKLENL